MSTIIFNANVSKINTIILLRLPKDLSAKLSSRALTIIKGTINGAPLHVVLEPDGKGSHWFKIDETLQRVANVAVGDVVTLKIEPTKEWIEPDVPLDLKKALESAPKAQTLWMDITPNARWDWIRWIQAVKTSETRQKHIEVAISKLNKGMRRPCCFNRNLCSDPTVSHNWVLLEP